MTRDKHPNTRRLTGRTEDEDVTARALGELDIAMQNIAGLPATLDVMTILGAIRDVRTQCDNGQIKLLSYPRWNSCVRDKLSATEETGLRFKVTGAVKAALATGEIHAADECPNIAAAPDLLAATKALLADDTHYVPLPYRDDLEAAIAKAEGRE